MLTPATGTARSAFLARRALTSCAPHFPDLPAGAFAENILTKGLVLYQLPIGTKLRVGGTLLEVTQIGKECHAACAIRKVTGDCVMPREGIFHHRPRGRDHQSRGHDRGFGAIEKDCQGRRG